ncbi:MAG: hypothetical protein NC238_02100 [Dehalobacter sp.]|nr:hypothetical protein [Dehalobacter sp.]
MKKTSIFFAIAAPMFLGYSFFTYITAGWMPSGFPLYIHIIISVIALLIWLVVIFLMRWRSASQPWNPVNFLFGLLTGGGFLFFIYLLQWSFVQPILGEASKYSIVSALYASPSQNRLHAIVGGFLCFVLQLIADFVLGIRFNRLE